MLLASLLLLEMGGIRILSPHLHTGTILASVLGCCFWGGANHGCAD